MGDWYESVVLPRVRIRESKTVAKAVLTALVSSRIVHLETSDSALAEPGHRPDKGVLKLLRKPDPHLFTLHTNGIAITTERCAYIPSDVERAICPACHSEAPDLDDIGWSDAVSDWYDTGRASLACPRCGRSSSLTRWGHVPNAAFGNLAFTFWNWPPFLPQLWLTTPADMIHTITSQRCCEVVAGKL